MSKGKYTPGPKITDIQILIPLLLDGKSVYWGERVKNSAWLMNMSVTGLNHFCKMGTFRFAVPTEEAS